MRQVVEMLNKIKNAQTVQKNTVSVPYSNFKYSLAKILEKEGFIGEIKKRGRKKKRILVRLKYEDRIPRIREIKMISKPGKRIYLQRKELYLPKSGYGILIVSTPKGLLTSREAKKMKIGGEAICEVW